MHEGSVVPAALVATTLLAVVALFQVALAIGMPWGLAAYGGRAPTLTAAQRVTSAVAFVVWCLVALIVVRAAGGSIWSPVPDTWSSVALWVVVGLLVVATVLNAITPSVLERAVWLPVTAVLLVAVVVIAVHGPQ